jgi:hypothetical protein
MWGAPSGIHRQRSSPTTSSGRPRSCVSLRCLHARHHRWEGVGTVGEYHHREGWQGNIGAQPGVRYMTHERSTCAELPNQRIVARNLRTGCRHGARHGCMGPRECHVYVKVKGQSHTSLWGALQHKEVVHEC